MTYEEALDHLRARGLPSSRSGWRELLPVTVHSLFGCYMTQDWPEEYGDWENAVQAWLEEDGDDPSDRSQAAQELQRLLDMELLDAVYRAIGGELLNIEYWPDEDFNVWLGKVRQYIIDAPPFPDPDLLTIDNLDDSAGS